MSQPSVVVVGAGVFGGFTALALQRQGAQVSLVDPWGPGHSRSSSGGESRILRATYGPEGVYVGWVVRSIELWKQFEIECGVPLFRRTGCLWLAGDDDGFERASLVHLRAHGVSFERLTTDAAARRFPQFHLDGVNWCIFEPDAGYLLARQACQQLQRVFVEEGGTYLHSAARPGDEGVELSNGDTLRADHYVFACGAWLGGLFPEVGADFVTASRQEVFFFGTPEGSSMYHEDVCPLWIDNGQRRFYGIPGTEGRGFKLADHSRGERVEPTMMERLPSETRLAAARQYMEFRFPGMKGAPLVESRVCQYEHSADSRFIIDRHPDNARIWLVGGGSGHGFKHGPALGERVANNVMGEMAIDPYFSLERFG